jgi:hypothetical protein
MPRRNEGPQSDASDGQYSDYSSSSDHEEDTRLPTIPRKRDDNAKEKMIELLRRLEDLIEHNVT